MPKRRTLDQKKKVARKRSAGVHVEIKPSKLVPVGVSSTSEPTSKKQNTPAHADSVIAKLLRIELPLVQKDLQRSITTAIVLLVALIGIYLFLRYN